MWIILKSWQQKLQGIYLQLLTPIFTRFKCRQLAQRLYLLPFENPGGLLRPSAAPVVSRQGWAAGLLVPHANRVVGSSAQGWGARGWAEVEKHAQRARMALCRETCSLGVPAPWVFHVPGFRSMLGWSWASGHSRAGSRPLNMAVAWPCVHPEANTHTCSWSCWCSLAGGTNLSRWGSSTLSPGCCCCPLTCLAGDTAKQRPPGCGTSPSWD